MSGRVRRALLFLPLLLFSTACQQSAAASETIVRAPLAKHRASEGEGLKSAIFAGGCFWGVEGVFSHVKGVKSAISGYHGGTRARADYKAVSAGRTLHAEAVKVTYDPAVVRYDQLLRIFFSVTADPTLKNRQGPDIGAHYRAALVPVTAGQRKVAAAYLRQMEKSGIWKRPIVTGIESYQRFYRAETYHQDFMLKNPRHPYILRWDAPKVRGLAKLFPKHFQKRFTKR
ncbi:MAG: peptide-methionine (S)-S-oxide reductase MsrA [Sphingomonadaceae bacterium]|nr:peptide-methionine (S)-S-oxide reductase MsrA [Sphingomonadaceae bacterium]